MQNQHAHQVALITGAARRIGAAIARQLHAEGVNVILHYHQSEAEALALAAALNQIRPHSAALVVGDLSELRILPDLIKKAYAHFGRLDILINNASRFYATPLGDITESAWLDLMNTNAGAPLFLSQAALPYLQEHAGCIINIGDIYGERPKPDYLAYSISKAALLMTTKALAVAAGPAVRVNTISPSTVMWAEGDNAPTPAIKTAIEASSVLKRIGSPQSIAKMVWQVIASADFMTGQNLIVDGGRLLVI